MLEKRQRSSEYLSYIESLPKEVQSIFAWNSEDLQILKSSSTRPIGDFLAKVEHDGDLVQQVISKVSTATQPTSATSDIVDDAQNNAVKREFLWAVSIIKAR
jgi:hypothetical protein